MSAIQAVVWMAVVYVAGNPGDTIKCNMWTVRGLEQTQTVHLKEKETTAEVRFPVKEDMLGDAHNRFVCERSR